MLRISLNFRNVGFRIYNPPQLKIPRYYQLGA
nr:MAG TPA: hypothetical protein [Caudoviricetes sp.]